ncbi:hypothetical protein FNQ90_03935 [Streptomyces alkaliphilus]|uniref:Uncharacterized protein n=1 Tax=Streptomyces alkaliphilus TaxID=1472722 RepID=A0A7W3Y0H1_9ACTN|nr:hypothetical protein [Streptomyces alkaliphilus]
MRRARSSRPRPTTASGRRPGSSRFRSPSQPRRSRVDRTTFGAVDGLNAGVDPTGNSVEVLLTRYAKCLNGRQDVVNRRIEDLLRE